MTLFRSTLRSLALSSVGAVSSIASGIHVLAAHYTGRHCIKDQSVFIDLLGKLKQKSRLINIESACDLIVRREKVDEPLIAFTFDDGFAECHSHIAPALERYGINAAFFVNPGFVHGDEAYIKNHVESVVSVPSKRPMTARMVRDLADRGFIIGAHTVDHANLSVSEENFLKYQIVECKKQVEEISGKSCDWFAWTYGGYRHISPKALQIAIETYPLLFSSDAYKQYVSNDGKILNRRHFECDWPVSHVRYFLRTQRHYPSNGIG